ncbi:cell adhesion molecule 1-like [Venturia canescens]|uniref:cell adhesion molecule 1-like n=1 Tax=Venturia canescens TaxID=32260 RepID=UPI001C9C5F98|nr:cell adhesion molecule 1-like [Venturia canescens]
MPRQQADWGKIIFVYILQLFSYATNAEHVVQLVAPSYVKFNDSATLVCNHNVAPDDLHKIEFLKDDKKILQYVRGRNDPLQKTPLPGLDFEPSPDGQTITLNNVRFAATGSYLCVVVTASPSIFTKSSNATKLQVIVPQSEKPHITFKQRVYESGETLEANCTSAPAHPVPHLTWFINGNEVDIGLVTPFPHNFHNRDLGSATSKLLIEVSELHAGDNGRLEIRCQSTIPGFVTHREQYADIRTKTVEVEIAVVPIQTSGALGSFASLLFVGCILHAVHPIIP